MPLLATLTAAAAPWQSIYGDSKVIPLVVTSIHLGGLLVGGGLALAADRATLRAARGDDEGRRRHLVELGAVHRPVLLALVAIFISGVLLTAADLATFFSSPVFWVKGGVVALLLLNGAWLARSERALQPRPPRAPRTDAPNELVVSAQSRHWRALRLASYASLALWMTTLVLGVAMVNA